MKYHSLERERIIKDDRLCLAARMAETISVTTSIVGLFQIYRHAVQGLYTGNNSIENLRLLQSYSLLMSILEDCAGIIQSPAGERHMNTTIVEASKQCTDLGQSIAFRLEKYSGSSAKSRIAFALAPWDKLQGMHKDFQSSVLLLHGLTQDLLLREVVESQNELRSSAAKTKATNPDVLNTMEGLRVGRFYPEQRREGSESIMTGRTQLTVSQMSVADVVTVADEVIASSIARGVHFDNDPSLILGTITVTHEDKPRFIPVRAKYDTASDVNFIPAMLVEKHGLSPLLVELEKDDGSDDNVFVGLNNQEHAIQHIITLQWCAATMHRVRTTQFHVADGLPYDMLLGNPFIQDNRVFSPPRVALPLRRKKRSTGKPSNYIMVVGGTEPSGTNIITAEVKAEAQRKHVHDHEVAEESQRERNEDAARRALEREARRLAKEQTSASSMVSTSPSPSSFSPNVGVAILPSSSSSREA